MRFAYADPPYLGCCSLYGHHHPDGLCWDDIATHTALIERLERDYPDGWALSLSVPSLRDILPLTPRAARICQWSKTFSAFKRGVRPAYAWEPVIVARGRNPHAGHPHPPPVKGGKQTTPKDWHEADGLLAPITLQKGLTGAKPESFCRAVLEWLGWQDGDTLDDLYPGTNVMGKVVALSGRTEG